MPLLSGVALHHGIPPRKMYNKVQEFSRRFEEYITLVLSFLVSSVFYRRKGLASANIRRIVIIKLDHIGDVILSIPAIANLRAHFPLAHVTMVANFSSEPIARYIPHVDEVLCHNARFFNRSGSRKTFDFARGMRFAREMRRREFDLIVDLRGSFASLLFALIAKSEYRIDRGTYLVQRKLGRWWNLGTRTSCPHIQIPLASEHEAEVNLHVLARAGLPTRSREMSLDLPQEDLDSADSLLREFTAHQAPLFEKGNDLLTPLLEKNDLLTPLLEKNDLLTPPLEKNNLLAPPLEKNNLLAPPLEKGAGGIFTTDELNLRPPIIVIHPGAPVPLKCWPAERYARLACQLLREYNAWIVLVGGKGEEQIALSVASAMIGRDACHTNGQVADLSGQTTLGQLAAVLRRTDLFIGNDSGPMHLAAACDTRVIGLFGPTSPQRFGPYGDLCAALRMERDCPPCMRNKCKIPRYRCIDRISVSDVMNAVRQMMPPD